MTENNMDALCEAIAKVIWCLKNVTRNRTYGFPC
jgi:hypothetical protein